MDDERASELAWQLAQLEASPGDPHLFARERALCEHLYWLLEQNSVRHRAQRCINAALSGRLPGELRLQRMQQTLLQLGKDEDVDLVRVHGLLFDAANYYDRTWLGSGMSFETRAGLRAIEDPAQQNRFAQLVRRGAVTLSGPRTLAVTRIRQRRRAAYAAGICACGWMLTVLWAMFEQGDVDSLFIVLYVLGALCFAVWLTRQLVLGLEEDAAIAAAASQGLQPRRAKLAVGKAKD